MIYKYSGANDSRLSLIDASDSTYNSNTAQKDRFRIVWAMNDDISLGIDGYRVLLHKHHLLFCTPLNKLDLIIENKDVVIYSFNRAFYCIRDHDNEVSCNGFLFLGSSVPVMVKLTKREQQKFKLLYQFFIEEFETIDHIQGEMLLVLLKRLLIMSVRIARKTLPDEYMPKSKLDIIRKFNLLVEMHFREKHKVAEYAEQLHISPKSLSNLFLRYYSESPLKVINNRLTLEAKRLLEFSNLNISEISDNLGFNDASHFSKFFKNQINISPKIFRSTL